MEAYFKLNRFAEYIIFIFITNICIVIETHAVLIYLFLQNIIVEALQDYSTEEQLMLYQNETSTLWTL